MKRWIDEPSRRLEGTQPCFALVAIAFLTLGDPSAAAPAASAMPANPIHILIHSPSPGEAVTNKVHQEPITPASKTVGE